MEAEYWLYLLSATSILLSFLIPKLFKSRGRSDLPPGPPSLPIIGHLHLIKDPVHRNLARISDRYGPVFSISFGARPVVVISSPTTVEECFVKNDVIFAGRPNLEGWRELSYDFTTMPVATYGPLWRNLRRISVLEIFSTARLNSFLAIRQDEVRSLVRNLGAATSRDGGGFIRVEMRPRVQELTFNVIMRMVSGKRFFGDQVENVEQANEFRDIIEDVFELSATSDPGDFVPLLRLVDFQGRKKRTKETKKKADSFLQGLIDERRSKSSADSGVESKSIIDSMLDFQAMDQQYTDDIIKGLILTLLAAGTDTSAVTIEWAMSLLLNEPDVLKKARAELDSYVDHHRLVDESDLHNLPYLQNIINEALRLFPPAPLLLPHEAIEDVTIGGFHVPRGTMLMVNAWAIHRDPKVWDDPTSFRPERYPGSYHQADAYRLIPFGLGRRGCPGSMLANRVVGLALAALLQCFEWERVSEELVDLHEGTGLTIPKAQPLEALCQTRYSMADIISQL